MADPRPPTRDELAKVFTNQRMLRAFEKLFDLIPADLIVLQDGISSATTIAETADQKSNEALSLLERLVEAVAFIAYSPNGKESLEEVDDVSPRLELGTLSLQQADAVEITGGEIAANLTNNQTILLASSTALDDGAAASVGTLSNAPTAGDPTKWVPIDDNGTIRYIPCW